MTYLEKARWLGNRLEVGLSTDRSVRALEGEGRPAIKEADRAQMLAALDSVGAVILFDKDMEQELIKKVRPDVLAKGADYREEDVVVGTGVKSWGGRAALVPLVDGRSTSKTLDWITPEALVKAPKFPQLFRSSWLDILPSSTLDLPGSWVRSGQ